MDKWGQKHIAKILTALTALDALLLAVGVKSVIDSPWVIFVLAILAFVAELLTSTGPQFPTLPAGTPPPSEPKPKAGK
jgi:hypothetical protein